MSARPADNLVLERFKLSLDEIYGARLERVVLYGSRARGDAGPSSDYDIAVFLRDSAGLWEESGPLAEIEMAVFHEMGAVINALPFAAGAYNDRTLLMHELRRDGVDL